MNKNFEFVFGLKDLFPLAVIGSVEMVKIGNKLTRGRSYEWGTVSIENESHCDFLKFTDLILSKNMFDLIDTTHAKHYQLFRAQRLREIGFKDNPDQLTGYNKSTDTGSQSIQDVYKAKKSILDKSIQEKEAYIKDNFIKKVKEKEIEIRDMENEVY
jgi:septin 6/8/11